MGTLRTIFALSVVFTHCWPAGMVFIGGQNAVQLFYIISGFLISFVLVENKTYKKVSSFYINRYLRLYPIYFVVAAISLAAILLTKQGHFLITYKEAPVSAIFLLIFSNIFLFGQDWVMFSGVKNNSLVFSTNFRKSEVNLFPGLIMPQSWTLGLELTFYLIAPFVLPKRKIILTLLFISLAIKVYLFVIGLGVQDPWSYRFFPAELSLFLFGALAHQILLPAYKSIFADKLQVVSDFLTIFLIVFSIIYFLLPINEFLKTALLFSFFIVLIPFSFVFQDRYSWDNWIGNLSYPIYIGHWLVISVAKNISENYLSLNNKYLVAIISVVFTIVFAIFLNKFIAEPFEKIRKIFRQQILPSKTQT